MAGAEVETLVRDGEAALVACDWGAAHGAFAAALAAEEVPAAIAGLGRARYWQGDHPGALRLLERAYRAHRAAREHRAAAAVAIHLAQLHGLIHANGAVVNGWIGHARRMLEACGRDCPERGWLELFLACVAADPDERATRAELAIEAGRRFRDPALEFDALGYLGKARIEQGAFAAGLGLVDEAVAAASAGVVPDPWAIGEIYCTLFHACELTMDVRRAEEWLAAVDGYVERTGELPISAICRMHYGGLLVAAGRWEAAERELLGSLEIYRHTYRGSRFEPLLRLAELRARQGRREEVGRLLDGHEERPGAALPRARVALASAPRLAVVILERELDRRGRGPVRAAELALLTRALLAAGDRAGAREVADELATCAVTTGQAAIAALAALATARVAAASGRVPRREYERAITAAADAELPRELAVARLELAELLTTEEPELARVEARMAFAGLDALRAAEADRAADLLRRLGGRGVRASSRGRVDGLTARQAEVLALMAEGLSNAEIAERLVISPRTAEHHVGNILAALGVGSRTEAVAVALRG